MTITTEFDRELYAFSMTYPHSPPVPHATTRASSHSSPLSTTSFFIPNLIYSTFFYPLSFPPHFSCSISMPHTHGLKKREERGTVIILLSIVMFSIIKCLGMILCDLNFFLFYFYIFMLLQISLVNMSMLSTGYCTSLLLK